MNSLTNMPPFYAGQKVVCLKDSSKSATGAQFKKDSIYTIVKMVFCCGEWRCVCKEVPYDLTEDTVWCHIKADLPYCCGMAKYFRAVDESFQSISLSEVITIESPLIPVN